MERTPRFDLVFAELHEIAPLLHGLVLAHGRSAPETTPAAPQHG